MSIAEEAACPEQHMQTDTGPSGSNAVRVPPEAFVLDKRRDLQ